MISELPRPVQTNDSATVCGEDSRVRELEIAIAEKTFEVVSLQGVVAEQEQRIAELVEEQDNYEARRDGQLRATDLQAENERLQHQVAETEVLKTENDKLRLQLSAAQTGEREAISSQKEALMQLAGIELKLALLESNMAEKDMELSQTKVLYNKLLVETALRPSDHFDIMNKDVSDDKKGIGNNDTSAASTLADSDTDSAQGSPELSTIQEEASSVAADSDARSDTMTVNASVDEYVPHTPPDSSRASEATFLQFETCSRAAKETEVWAMQKSGSTEAPQSHRTAQMSDPASSNRTLPAPEVQADNEQSRTSGTSLPRVRSVSPMRIVAPTRDSNGVPLERPRGRLDIANVVRGVTPPPCVTGGRTASPIFGNEQAASPMRAATPMRSAMSEVRLPSPMRRVQTVGALPAAQGRTLWTEIRAASPVGSRADLRTASPVAIHADVRAASPAASRADIRAASPAVTRSLTEIRTSSPIRDPRAASPVRTDVAVSPSLAASSSMTWKLPKPLWTEIRAASPVGSRGLRASTPVSSRADLRATSPGASHLEQRTASPVATRTPCSEMRTASPSLRTDARAASPGINWKLPTPLWTDVRAASPARSPATPRQQCSSPLRTPPMRAASPVRNASPMRAVSAMSPLRPTTPSFANKAFDFPVTSALFPDQASPQGSGDCLPEKCPASPSRMKFLGHADRSLSSQSWQFGSLDASNSYLLQPNFSSFKISP